MGGELAWVTCLRGWRANVGGLGSMLALVVWVACLRGWPASVGDVGGVLAGVVC